MVEAPAEPSADGQVVTQTSCHASALPSCLYKRANRMLGSAAEAEDVVQDVWLRWQTADRGVVRDAAAFLVTAATRLAINIMQSARARRGTHVAPWQSEPVDTSSDPRLAVERNQALACGVRMLLEKLTPTERAAYILREAFDYAYRDIASVLRLAEANARQVVTRARPLAAFLFTQHIAGVEAHKLHQIRGSNRSVTTASNSASGRGGGNRVVERLHVWTLTCHCPRLGTVTRTTSRSTG